MAAEQKRKGARMDGTIWQFVLSLAAVTVLVLLAHRLGYSRTARLQDEAEARDILRHLPGGFETVDIALDEEGAGAIARDRQGRLAVVYPHGGQFVARLADTSDADGDRLAIRTGGDSHPHFIKPVAGTQGWADTDVSASRS